MLSVSGPVMSVSKTSDPPWTMAPTKLSPPLPGVAVSETVQSEFTV